MLPLFSKWYYSPGLSPRPISLSTPVSLLFFYICYLSMLQEFWMGFRGFINSLNLNAGTFKGRSRAFISFSKASGTQKKAKSPDSHALPQLTSSPWLKLRCVWTSVLSMVTNTHSPGLSSVSLSHTSLSPSHDDSPLLHTFTYPKLNSCPTSLHRLLSQPSQPSQKALPI